MSKNTSIKYPNLTGKVVLITGASEGLGEALARAFAQQHCNIYICARRYDKLAALAKELNEKEQYQGVIPLSLDVTKPKEVARVADTLWNHRNGIDIWINNAGMDRKLSVEEITPEQLQEITAVNYFGLVYGTQEAAKVMKMQKFPGDIVQILSTSSFTPRANESAYCGAKAAADLFSQSTQLELKPHGIRVIPMYPGGMDTQFFRKAGLQLPPQAMNPKDIADVVLYAVCLPRNIILAPRIFRLG